MTGDIFSADTPTMKPFKLSGVQSSDGIRHAGGFTDSTGVDSSNSEVERVALKQPTHRVFTDLDGVIIALGPVFCANLTSEILKKKLREGD